MPTIDATLQMYGSMLNMMQSMNQVAASDTINNEIQRMNGVIDEANRGQDDLNKKFLGAGGLIGKMTSGIKKMAGEYLSLDGAKKLMNLSDEQARITTRSNQVNDGKQSTDQLNQMIFAASQRSRTSSTDTANTVTALGTKAGDAFGSTQEMVAFAEQLNKNFVMGGATTAEMNSTITQLTEGLGKGVLSGEQLNSAFALAPNMLQSMADYLAVDTEQIKVMAENGQISAETFKNAMFAAASETDAQFAQMPVTFGQLATSIKNQALMMFQPLFLKLQQLANNESFQDFIGGLLNGLSMVASLVVQVVGIMGMIGTFIANNWSVIAPILWSVVSALIAYNAMSGAAWLQTVLHTGAIIAKTIASAAEAVATNVMILAQEGLNAAIKANPLMWLIMLIGVVVMAIVRWIQSVGGLKVAWLIVVNAIMTWAENMALSIATMIFNMLNKIEELKYGFAALKVAILNTLGNLKVMGLMILQKFINDAIDLVNKLIDAFNLIPGMSVDTIDHVHFADDAEAKNKAEQTLRNEDLWTKKITMEQTIAENNSKVDKLEVEIEQRLQKRRAGIDDAIAKSENKKAQDVFDYGAFGGLPDLSTMGGTSNYGLPVESGYGSFGEGLENVNANTAVTAENTSEMVNQMDPEESGYLRDIVEREAINKFTTAEVRLDFTANASLNSNMDIDGFVNQFTNVLQEQLMVTAEGVHQ